MKITAIKQQVKNPERVSVFVDEKYSFSLTLDQLVSEKLKKEQEISEQDLQYFQKVSGEGKLRGRALEWVMGRPHSEREFRDYLFRKKAEKDHIEKLVEEFQSKKYIDDEQFASWFFEGRKRKNKSISAMKAELRAKGISQETIQSIVKENTTEFGEITVLKLLVNKLSKRSRYQDQQKLIAYLLSKGFRYDDIKQSLNEG